MKIPGPSRHELDKRNAEFTALVSAALRRVMKRVAARLGHVTAAASSHVTLDDIASTREEWTQEVDGELLPYLAEAYGAGVTTTALGLRDALGAGATFPAVRSEDAELFLAGRRNPLVGIGDELWANAREGLLGGIQRGESVGELAKLVTQAADVTEPRAQTIARTEANAAMNRGSLDQMRATGLGGTKTWLTAGDDRVRPSHEEADGQTVPIDAQFDIDGELWDEPGDVNCRCTLTYDVPDDEAQAFADEPDLNAYVPSSLGFDEVAAQAQAGAFDDVEERFAVDTYLEQLVSVLRFDGPPQLVTNEELDNYILRGETELYRGVTQKEFAEEFMTGKYFGGTGMYGNGTYTAAVKTPGSVAARIHAQNIALDYSDAYSYQGEVLRMSLRSDARTILDTELDKLLEREEQRLETMPEGPAKVRLQQLVLDPGRYAAARGYDAFVHERSGVNYIIVLNRTAVRVARDFTRKSIAA